MNETNAVERSALRLFDPSRTRAGRLKLIFSSVTRKDNQSEKTANDFLKKNNNNNNNEGKRRQFHLGGLSVLFSSLLHLDNTGVNLPKKKMVVPFDLFMARLPLFILVWYDNRSH